MLPPEPSLQYPLTRNKFTNTQVFIPYPRSLSFLYKLPASHFHSLKSLLSHLGLWMLLLPYTLSHKLITPLLDFCSAVGQKKKKISLQSPCLLVSVHWNMSPEHLMKTLASAKPVACVVIGCLTYNWSCSFPSNKTPTLPFPICCLDVTHYWHPSCGKEASTLQLSSSKLAS